MYKSGRVILDVNTGTWMERFEVMQGSNILFDSGYWATNGNAYSDDFDRFIIEFSPGKETTLEFQQLDTGQVEAIKILPVPLPNGILRQLAKRRYFQQPRFCECHLAKELEPKTVK